MKKVAILTALILAVLTSCSTSKFHTKPVKSKFFNGCGSGKKCLTINR